MDYSPTNVRLYHIIRNWDANFIGASSNVLLVKIEGPVRYTIYHHLPVVKGVSSNPSIFINQPMGIWDIYGSFFLLPENGLFETNKHGGDGNF